jgi:hypothetical protein
MGTNTGNSREATGDSQGRNIGKGGTNSDADKNKASAAEGQGSVEPDEEYSTSMDIAKLFHKLLGRNYYLAFKGAAGISGIGALIALAGMFNFGQGFGSMTALTGRAPYLLPFFACLIVLYVAWSMITIPSDSSCPNCKEPFRMFQEERYFIDKVQLEDQTVRNYRVLKKCNKCGHKQSYPDMEEDYFSS